LPLPVIETFNILSKLDCSQKSTNFSNTQNPIRTLAIHTLVFFSFFTKIIFSACIRFFGYLSTADPNSLTKFPLFTADVFDAVNRFDAFDPVRRKLAFETFAIITTTSGAKQFLASEQCKQYFNRLQNFSCIGSNSEDKSQGFVSFSHTIASVVFDNLEQKIFK
jgi:hypothetical protein